MSAEPLTTPVCQTCVSWLLPGATELFDELTSSRSSSPDTSALADSPFISSCAAPAAPDAFFCFRLTFDFSFNLIPFLPERIN